ncbi:MAG: hypothetical protein KKH94_09100 [Candidatus Omnitrophica bacterium]|nr:hypothetical protein [Candidatus Omnitrophota bacterium]
MQALKTKVSAQEAVIADLKKQAIKQFGDDVKDALQPVVLAEVAARIDDLEMRYELDADEVKTLRDAVSTQEEIIEDEEERLRLEDEKRQKDELVKQKAEKEAAKKAAEEKIAEEQAKRKQVAEQMAALQKEIEEETARQAIAAIRKEVEDAIEAENIDDAKAALEKFAEVDADTRAVEKELQDAIAAKKQVIELRDAAELARRNAEEKKQQAVDDFIKELEGTPLLQKKKIKEIEITLVDKKQTVAIAPTFLISKEQLAELDQRYSEVVALLDLTTDEDRQTLNRLRDLLAHKKEQRVNYKVGLALKASIVRHIGDWTNDYMKDMSDRFIQIQQEKRLSDGDETYLKNEIIDRLKQIIEHAINGGNPDRATAAYDALKTMQLGRWELTKLYGRLKTTAKKVEKEKNRAIQALVAQILTIDTQDAYLTVFAQFVELQKQFSCTKDEVKSIHDQLKEQRGTLEGVRDEELVKLSDQIAKIETIHDFDAVNEQFIEHHSIFLIEEETVTAIWDLLETKYNMLQQKKKTAIAAFIEELQQKWTVKEVAEMGRTKRTLETEHKLTDDEYRTIDAAVSDQKKQAEEIEKHTTAAEKALADENIAEAKVAVAQFATVDVDTSDRENALNQAITIIETGLTERAEKIETLLQEAEKAVADERIDDAKTAVASFAEIIEIMSAYTKNIQKPEARKEELEELIAATERKIRIRELTEEVHVAIDAKNISGAKAAVAKFVDVDEDTSAIEKDLNEQITKKERTLRIERLNTDAREALTTKDVERAKAVAAELSALDEDTTILEQDIAAEERTIEIKQLTKQAEAAIDAGRIDDAKAAVESISRVDANTHDVEERLNDAIVIKAREIQIRDLTQEIRDKILAEEIIQATALIAGFADIDEDTGDVEGRLRQAIAAKEQEISRRKERIQQLIQIAEEAIEAENIEAAKATVSELADIKEDTDIHEAKLNKDIEDKARAIRIRQFMKEAEEAIAAEEIDAAKAAVRKIAVEDEDISEFEEQIAAKEREIRIRELTQEAEEAIADGEIDDAKAAVAQFANVDEDTSAIENDFNEQIAIKERAILIAQLLQKANDAIEDEDIAGAQTAVAELAGVDTDTSPEETILNQLIRETQHTITIRQLIHKARDAIENEDISGAKATVEALSKVDKDTSAIEAEIVQTIETKEREIAQRADRIKELTSTVEVAIKDEDIAGAEAAVTALRAIEEDTRTLEASLNQKIAIKKAELGRRANRITELIQRAEEAIDNKQFDEARAVVAAFADIDADTTSIEKRLGQEIEEKARTLRIQELMQKTERAIADEKIDDAKAIVAKFASVDEDTSDVEAELTQAIEAKEREMRIRQFTKEAEEAIAAEEIDVAKAAVEAIAAEDEETSELEGKIKIKEREIRIREFTKEAEEAIAAERIDTAKEAIKKIVAEDEDTSELEGEVKAKEREIAIWELTQEAEVAIVNERINDARTIVAKFAQVAEDTSVVETALNKKIAEKARQIRIRELTRKANEAIAAERIEAANEAVTAIAAEDEDASELEGKIKAKEREIRIREFTKEAEEAIAAEEIDAAKETVRKIAAEDEETSELDEKIKAKEREIRIRELTQKAEEAIENERIADAKAAVVALSNVGENTRALENQLYQAIEETEQIISERAAKIQKFITQAETAIKTEDMRAAKEAVEALGGVDADTRTEELRLNHAISDKRIEINKRAQRVKKLVSETWEAIHDERIDDAKAAVAALGEIQEDTKEVEAELNQAIVKQERQMQIRALTQGTNQAIEDERIDAAKAAVAKFADVDEDTSDVEAALNQKIAAKERAIRIRQFTKEAEEAIAAEEIGAAKEAVKKIASEDENTGDLEDAIAAKEREIRIREFTKEAEEAIAYSDTDGAKAAVAEIAGIDGDTTAIEKDLNDQIAAIERRERIRTFIQEAEEAIAAKNTEKAKEIVLLIAKEDEDTSAHETRLNDAIETKEREIRIRQFTEEAEEATAAERIADAKEAVKKIVAEEEDTEGLEDRLNMKIEEKEREIRVRELTQQAEQEIADEEIDAAKATVEKIADEYEDTSVLEEKIKTKEREIRIRQLIKQAEEEIADKKIDDAQATVANIAKVKEDTSEVETRLHETIAVTMVGILTPQIMVAMSEEELTALEARLPDYMFDSDAFDDLTKRINKRKTALETGKKFIDAIMTGLAVSPITIDTATMVRNARHELSIRRVPVKENVETRIQEVLKKFKEAEGYFHHINNALDVLEEEPLTEAAVTAAERVRSARGRITALNVELPSPMIEQIDLLVQIYESTINDTVKATPITEGAVVKVEKLFVLLKLLIPAEKLQPGMKENIENLRATLDEGLARIRQIYERLEEVEKEIAVDLVTIIETLLKQVQARSVERPNGMDDVVKLLRKILTEGQTRIEQINTLLEKANTEITEELVEEAETLLSEVQERKVVRPYLPVDRPTTHMDKAVEELRTTLTAGKTLIDQVKTQLEKGKEEINRLLVEEAERLLAEVQALKVARPDGMDADVADLRATFDDGQQRITQINTLLDQAKEEITPALVEDAERLLEEVQNLLVERPNGMDDAVKQLRQTLTEGQTRIEQINIVLEKANTEITEALVEEVEALLAEVQARKVVRPDGMDDAVKQLRQTLTEGQIRIKQINTLLEKANTEITEALVEEVEALLAEIQDRKVIRQDGMDDAVKQLRQTLTEGQTRIKQINTLLEKANTEITEALVEEAEKLLAEIQDRKVIRPDGIDDAVKQLRQTLTEGQIRIEQINIVLEKANTEITEALVEEAEKLLAEVKERKVVRPAGMDKSVKNLRRIFTAGEKHIERIYKLLDQRKKKITPELVATAEKVLEEVKERKVVRPIGMDEAVAKLRSIYTEAEGHIDTIWIQLATISDESDGEIKAAEEAIAALKVVLPKRLPAATADYRATLQTVKETLLTRLNAYVEQVSIKKRHNKNAIRWMSELDEVSPETADQFRALPTVKEKIKVCEIKIDSLSKGMKLERNLIGMVVAQYTLVILGADDEIGQRVTQKIEVYQNALQTIIDDHKGKIFEIVEQEKITEDDLDMLTKTFGKLEKVSPRTAEEINPAYTETIDTFEKERDTLIRDINNLLERVLAFDEKDEKDKITQLNEAWGKVGELETYSFSQTITLRSQVDNCECAFKREIQKYIQGIAEYIQKDKPQASDIASAEALVPALRILSQEEAQTMQEAIREVEENRNQAIQNEIDIFEQAQDPLSVSNLIRAYHAGEELETWGIDYTDKIEQYSNTLFDEMREIYEQIETLLRGQTIQIGERTWEGVVNEADVARVESFMKQLAALDVNLIAKLKDLVLNDISFEADPMPDLGDRLSAVQTTLENVVTVLVADIDGLLPEEKVDVDVFLPPDIKEAANRIQLLRSLRNKAVPPYQQRLNKARLTRASAIEETINVLNNAITPGIARVPKVDKLADATQAMKQLVAWQVNSDDDNINVEVLETNRAQYRDELAAEISRISKNIDDTLRGSTKYVAEKTFEGVLEEKDIEDLEKFINELTALGIDAIDTVKEEIPFDEAKVPSNLALIIQEKQELLNTVNDLRGGVTRTQRVQRRKKAILEALFADRIDDVTSELQRLESIGATIADLSLDPESREAQQLVAIKADIAKTKADAEVKTKTDDKAKKKAEADARAKAIDEFIDQIRKALDVKKDTDAARDILLDLVLAFPDYDRSALVAEIAAAKITIEAEKEKALTAKVIEEMRQKAEADARVKVAAEVLERLLQKIPFDTEDEKDEYRIFRDIAPHTNLPLLAKTIDKENIEKLLFVNYLFNKIVNGDGMFEEIRFVYSEGDKFQDLNDILSKKENSFEQIKGKSTSKGVLRNLENELPFAFLLDAFRYTMNKLEGDKTMLLIEMPPELTSERRGKIPEEKLRTFEADTPVPDKEKSMPVEEITIEGVSSLNDATIQALIAVFDNQTSDIKKDAKKVGKFLKKFRNEFQGASFVFGYLTPENLQELTNDDQKKIENLAKLIYIIYQFYEQINKTRKKLDFTDAVAGIVFSDAPHTEMKTPVKLYSIVETIGLGFIKTTVGYSKWIGEDLKKGHPVADLINSFPSIRYDIKTKMLKINMNDLHAPVDMGEPDGPLEGQFSSIRTTDTEEQVTVANFYRGNDGKFRMIGKTKLSEREQVLIGQDIEASIKRIITYGWFTQEMMDRILSEEEQIGIFLGGGVFGEYDEKINLSMTAFSKMQTHEDGQLTIGKDGRIGLTPLAERASDEELTLLDQRIFDMQLAHEIDEKLSHQFSGAKHERLRHAVCVTREIERFLAFDNLRDKELKPFLSFFEGRNGKNLQSIADVYAETVKKRKDIDDVGYYFHAIVPILNLKRTRKLVGIMTRDKQDELDLPIVQLIKNFVDAERPVRKEGAAITTDQIEGAYKEFITQLELYDIIALRTQKRELTNDEKERIKRFVVKSITGEKDDFRQLRALLRGEGKDSIFESLSPDNPKKAFDLRKHFPVFEILASILKGEINGTMRITQEDHTLFGLKYSELLLENSEEADAEFILMHDNKNLPITSSSLNKIRRRHETAKRAYVGFAEALQLAFLLHDIGISVSLAGHEEVAEEISEKMLTKFGLDSVVKEKALWFIRHHVDLGILKLRELSPQKFMAILDKGVDDLRQRKVYTDSVSSYDIKQELLAGLVLFAFIDMRSSQYYFQLNDAYIDVLLEFAQLPLVEDKQDDWDVQRIEYWKEWEKDKDERQKGLNPSIVRAAVYERFINDYNISRIEVDAFLDTLRNVDEFRYIISILRHLGMLNEDNYYKFLFFLMQIVRVYQEKGLRINKLQFTSPSFDAQRVAGKLNAILNIIDIEQLQLENIKRKIKPEAKEQELFTLPLSFEMEPAEDGGSRGILTVHTHDWINRAVLESDVIKVLFDTMQKDTESFAAFAGCGFFGTISFDWFRQWFEKIAETRRQAEMERRRQIREMVAAQEEEKKKQEALEKQVNAYFNKFYTLVDFDSVRNSDAAMTDGTWDMKTIELSSANLAFLAQCNRIKEIIKSDHNERDSQVVVFSNKYSREEIVDYVKAIEAKATGRDIDAIEIGDSFEVYAEDGDMNTFAQNLSTEMEQQYFKIQKEHMDIITQLELFKNRVVLIAQYDEDAEGRISDDSRIVRDVLGIQYAVESPDEALPVLSNFNYDLSKDDNTVTVNAINQLNASVFHQAGRVWKNIFSGLEGEEANITDIAFDDTSINQVYSLDEWKEFKKALEENKRYNETIKIAA